MSMLLLGKVKKVLGWREEDHRTRFFSKLLTPPIPRPHIPLHGLLPSSRIPIRLCINLSIVTGIEIQHRSTTTSQDNPFDSWCMTFN